MTYGNKQLNNLLVYYKCKTNRAMFLVKSLTEEQISSFVKRISSSCVVFLTVVDFVVSETVGKTEGGKGDGNVQFFV